MAVTLDKVAPGIALSPGDANKLKKEIAAYVEGAAGIAVGQLVTWPDFKDETKTKRVVAFRVLAINGRDIHVALEKFERRG